MNYGKQDSIIAMNQMLTTTTTDMITQVSLHLRKYCDETQPLWSETQLYI